MTNYMFIYHSPPSPDDAAPDPEQMQEVMQQWMTWAEKVGDRMVDFGNPLGGGVRVAPDGQTSPSQREVSGYSVLRADSFDEVQELARNHPHLTMPGGCEIEIHEVQPIPGM